MNRRNFLRAGGLLVAGGAAVAATGKAVVGRLGLHVGFAPAGGGALAPAPQWGGSAPGSEAEIRLAMRGCEAVAGGVEIEACLGPEAPWFQVASAVQRDGLACVSPPRRFEVGEGFALRVNGQVLEFGSAGLPLRQGHYVVALGREPHWEALRLEGGRLAGAEGLAHVVVGVA